MRIGGTEITGVNRKFWIIAVSALVFLLLAGYLYVNQPEPEDPLVTPAVPTRQITQWANDSQLGWWKERVDAYGLQRASFDDLTTNYAQNVGLPVRFKAYVPPDDEIGDRPSLVVNKNGWSFRPSVFIEPTAPQTEESIANSAEQITEGVPIVLGVPQSANIAAGASYEFSGVLYWTSTQLNPESEEELQQGYPISPVVLVAEARELSPAELTAPTTQVADLDYVMEWNGLRVTISRVEWSAGNEVRACVSVTNATNIPAREMWEGVDSTGNGAQLQLSDGAGFFPGSPEETSPLATQTALAENGSAVGYIIFDEKAPSAGPTEPITLSFPALNPEDENPVGNVPERFSIRVSPSQFEDLRDADAGDSGVVSGCTDVNSLS